MAARATEFLSSLSEEQRKKACFPYADKERVNWHFVPRIYPGVPLQDLSADQKRLVHRLLQAALSGAGYHKTTTIMQLEDVLRQLAEARGRKAPHRDPGRYSLAFFGVPGKPGAKDAWALRLQGHHISWNFSSVDNRIVATTPAFLGANPAEVMTGPHAGLRALPDEEDLARELLATLTAEQEKVVILADRAPKDVLCGPGRKKEILGEPKGLTHAAMEKNQQTLLEHLIQTYVHNLKRDLARAQWSKIQAAGLGKVHFAWMGSKRRGVGHYYRIHGPTFAIEYDNTQNGANHVHTVWHDLTNDFGRDPLAEHYHDHHHEKK